MFGISEIELHYDIASTAFSVLKIFRRRLLRQRGKSSKFFQMIGLWIYPRSNWWLDLKSFLFIQNSCFISTIKSLKLNSITKLLLRHIKHAESSKFFAFGRLNFWKDWFKVQHSRSNEWLDLKSLLHIYAKFQFW